MSRLSRRQLLALAPAATVSSAFGILRQGHAGDEEKLVALVVAGPIKVVDVLPDISTSMGNEENGPTAAEILKSLEPCRLFIIARKEQQDTREWEFAGRDYPQLAISGPLRHKLKDKAGRSFVFWFSDLLLGDTRLHNSEAPPTTRLKFTVYVSTEEERPLGVMRRTKRAFSPKQPIVYDIEGNVRKA